MKFEVTSERVIPIQILRHSVCQINTKVGSSVTYNATKKSTKINPCKIYDSQCGRYGPQIVLSANMTATAHRGESLDRFCQPMWQLRPIRGNTLNFSIKCDSYVR